MLPVTMLLLLIVTNHLVSVMDLEFRNIKSPKMTCVPISVAMLSSRSDNKFSQLRLFTDGQFISNFTKSCGTFQLYVLIDLSQQTTQLNLWFRQLTTTLYARSFASLIKNLCSILQARPMIVLYLHDYEREHHGSSAAYFLFLKLFTLLGYPMLTFNFFHPFHPIVSHVLLLLN